MTFSLWSPPSLTPAQSGAMPDIIGNLLRGYNGVVNAKYLPKEKESKIFANQIGPLATLATSPMFLQNPQFQQALSNLISKNSHLLGHGFEGIGGGQGAIGGANPNTYAGQVGQRVDEAGNLAEDLSQAGGAQTKLSGAAGWLEDNFGDLGKQIVKHLSNGRINSNLAQKENQFETHLQNLKKNATDTGMLSAKDAEEVFAKRKNETRSQQFMRIQKTVPALFQQNESYAPRDADAKIARDAQERAQYETERGGQNENANSGFTHVQGPDGSTGYVPADKARQLIQAGQLKAIP